MTEFIGGGPFDGARCPVIPHLNLMLMPVLLSETIFSPTEMHAYVRLNENQFVYDGLRAKDADVPANTLFDFRKRQ